MGDSVRFVKFEKNVSREKGYPKTRKWSDKVVVFFLDEK